jgi:uncharacterized protein
MSLLEAINDSSLSRVQELVDKGIYHEQILSDGDLLLSAASLTEDPEIIKVLIDAGASPNWEELGRELFEDAIMENHTELVETLVMAGAIINPVDGKMPLTIAAANGSLELVQYLIENNAEVDVVDQNGNFALLSAAESYHEEVFNYLFSLCSPNLQELAQKSALISSASDRSSEAVNIVSLLINTGVNINLQYENMEHGTVLMRATQFRNIRFVQALIKSGANPNIQDRNGVTALMIAAKCQNDVEKKNAPQTREIQQQLIQILAAAGADVNIKDNNGKTCLDLARNFSSLEIVESLSKLFAES